MNLTKIALGVTLVAAPLLGWSQIAASFTVQHAGLAPSAEAMVNVGDTIQFLYGSGGAHPMTSGHGTGIESPVFFPTVTVTAGTPEAFCTLEEPGVYYFHCGTNPGNSNNWGTLNVVDPTSGIGERPVATWAPSWNASLRQLLLNGTSLPNQVALVDMSGKLAQTWNLTGSNATLQVADLPAGMYILRGDDGVNVTFWLQ
ncbi:MAG: T9SS type A sorting domain-containing protein [Flavobacteriales bacterium]|nr:T9SS type A sorting domain-containing protein [Flavobacteriales bacterium]